MEAPRVRPINPFDRVIARVLQRKWVPPSVARGESPTAARTRSAVQALCHHRPMDQGRMTALTVDVPAYRRELTDAIDEVLRAYLPVRTAPAVRPKPHLADNTLETYARLLWHETLSPLRFGPDEIRAYALNVLDSIRATWPKPLDRKAALQSMGRVAAQAASDTQLDRTARALARELSRMFTDRVKCSETSDNAEPSGTDRPTEAGRAWMDAAAADMRRRTGRSESLCGTVGPAWTRGEVEAPAGERDMGTWKAAVYTDEQKRRLGMDSDGGSFDSEVSGDVTALSAEEKQ